MIGGGPSISLVDFELLRGERLVVTNNAYRLAPWADVLYFMDCAWYNWHIAEIASFTGLKVTTCSDCERNNEPGIIYLKHGTRHGLDNRPDYLARGASSGYGGVIPQSCWIPPISYPP